MPAGLLSWKGLLLHPLAILHKLLHAIFELAQRRPLILSAEALVQQSLQPLRNGHFFETPLPHLLQQFPLFVRCRIGVKEQDNDHSQGVDVGPIVILLGRCLFGGAEQLGPYFGAKSFLIAIRYERGVVLDGGLPVLDPLGQAEVDQSATAILTDHYVVQFYVPMDYPPRVQVAQSCQHLQAHTIDLHQFCGRKWSTLALSTATLEENRQVHLCHLA
jgi:hypothetical protein